ncbi:CDP-glucose 4,6-dehydratase [Methylovorus glucosotrophus]|uniref:CDP-glucose 4,6-dehydratase n=1 Tax=Methylovorus glucosotrophus TaxID=266009 RepID=UPI0013319480|nr:CDP-glucose 4,6-dehydratase [Methylovorus glucosotrophus]
MTPSFWRGRKVFLTGHTGFKGGWMSLWMQSLGANLKGFSLEPPTSPSLFEIASISDGMTSDIGDVRDLARLTHSLQTFQPEIVFHMAAQPLVRYSYKNPVETYATNLMGTVHLLEAVRHTPSVKAVVIITTDKCYENREWAWGYRENEPMGGFDPYSNSKGCAELATAAYRSSFFNPENFSHHGVAIATVRAGNVIGGGDWAGDRLIPDILMAIEKGSPVTIRNPNAIRPWQHVLEPISGYMQLAERMISDGPTYSEAWNFGPNDNDARPVSWIVDRMVNIWGNGASWQIDNSEQPHEATYLKLDISKAKTKLQWQPRINLDQALEWIIDWHKAYLDGRSMQDVTKQQIMQYQHLI